MASATQQHSLLDPATMAARWLAEYCRAAPLGDVMKSGEACWSKLLEELAGAFGDELGHARERVQRQAEDIGTG
ncbi:hypothetical protein ABTE24_20605, partial [Acinetobacter baumannii]